MFFVNELMKNDIKFDLVLAKASQINKQKRGTESDDESNDLSPNKKFESGGPKTNEEDIQSEEESDEEEVLPM